MSSNPGMTPISFSGKLSKNDRMFIKGKSFKQIFFPIRQIVQTL